MNARDLMASDWVLTIDERRDILGFQPDGSLSGVRLWEREHRWTLDGDDLTLLDNAGRVTACLRAADGYFEGVSYIDPVERQCSLKNTGKIASRRHYRERANDRILSESRMGSSRDFMFITFNSLGKPFSGVLNEWEMYHLPNELSVDYLRFSSTNTPRSWYVDKVDRVYPQIKSCAEIGYNKFIFCGMSAGGYAAIVFAEMLSEEFPELPIYTVVCNPTLMLGEKYHADLSTFPDTLRSSLPRDPLRREDGHPVDIPELFEQSMGRVCHEIHYDSGNDFEVFQVEKLPIKSNVNIIAHHLGVEHGEGTIQIFKSGSIKDTLVRHLPDLYPVYVG